MLRTLMVIMTLSAMLLVACNNSPKDAVHPFSIGPHALSVTRDECKIASISKRLYGTINWNERRYGNFDIFRQDEHSLIRFVHRGQDLNFLRHIIDDDKFHYTGKCRSDFVVSLDLRTNNGIVFTNAGHEYNIFADEKKNLCQTHDIQEKVYPSRTDSLWKNGIVTTCMNIKSKRTSFGVQYSDVHYKR